jgi:hypothetical protein
MSTYVRVFGAVGVHKYFGGGSSGQIEHPGALDAIDGAKLSDGDIGMVVTGRAISFYRMFEGHVGTGVEPLLNGEGKRWRLISMEDIAGNLRLTTGAFVLTDQIRALGNSISLTIPVEGTGVPVAVATLDSFWVNKLAVESDEMVTNLNAQFIQGHGIDSFVLSDGSVPFVAPVAGVNPVGMYDLTTKEYVDGMIGSHDHPNAVKRDGSRSFLAPIAGADPTHEAHLATKHYVDQEIEHKVSVVLATADIVYRRGHAPVPVGAEELVVDMGTELVDHENNPSYVVSGSLVYEGGGVPSVYGYTVTSYQPQAFRVRFSGVIDSEGYSFSWVSIKN